MNRTAAAKVLAGAFYFGGALFAIYIGLIALNGNTMFTLSGLIIGAMGVCIPVALATLLLVSITKRTDKRYKIVRVFVIAVFAIYSLLIIHLTFRSSWRMTVRTMSMTDYLKWNVNVIPFRTIREYLHRYANDTINISLVKENLLGNLMVFSPMGILLPCLFRKLRKLNSFILVMLIILLGIESGQVVTRTGSFDVDDIILNLVGAIVLFGIWNLKIVKRSLAKLYILEDV